MLLEEELIEEVAASIRTTTQLWELESVRSSSRPGSDLARVIAERLMCEFDIRRHDPNRDLRND